jgi:condensin-2 complex subunit H2
MEAFEPDRNAIRDVVNRHVRLSRAFLLHTLHIVVYRSNKMDEGEEEAARNRFAHLLNPIKDLAENWTINIAQELQDYLGELHLIKFKIGGMSGLNFTEGMTRTQNFIRFLFTVFIRSLIFVFLLLLLSRLAALLIQGAVGIYSKKVEYLFHLVTRSLAAITENRYAIAIGLGRGFSSSTSSSFLFYNFDLGFYFCWCLFGLFFFS